MTTSKDVVCQTKGNDKVGCNWHVFFEGNDPLSPQVVRVASDCLGNALTVAKEWARRCNVRLIGVIADIGVGTDIRD